MTDNKPFNPNNLINQQTAMHLDVISVFDFTANTRSKFVAAAADIISITKNLTLQIELSWKDHRGSRYLEITDVLSRIVAAAIVYAIQSSDSELLEKLQIWLQTYTNFPTEYIRSLLRDDIAGYTEEILYQNLITLAGEENMIRSEVDWPFEEGNPNQHWKTFGNRLITREIINITNKLRQIMNSCVEYLTTEGTFRANVASERIVYSSILNNLNAFITAKIADSVIEEWKNRETEAAQDTNNTTKEDNYRKQLREVFILMKYAADGELKAEAALFLEVLKIITRNKHIKIYFPGTAQSLISYIDEVKDLLSQIQDLEGDES